MRQIGSLTDAEQSQLFADYLQTQGIAAHAEQDEAQWAIWVRDENDVDRAREELSTFLQDPVAPRYREVRREARRLRDQQQRAQQAAARRTIDMRRHWSRPITRRAPLTMILIGVCVLVALTSNFGAPRRIAGRAQYGIVMRTLGFCDLNRYASQPEDGLQEIRQGQLWRLVTPIFLHYGLIHLGFNMFWLYYLGAQVEMRRGSWSFAGMILLMAVFSNLLQYFVGGPNFLGISGVNYGLLGYIWMQKTFNPTSGYLVSDSTIVILLLFLVFGFVGAFDKMVGGVANWAHLGGLIAGMALGYAPVLRQRL